ncbi:Oidioi.mRNA.OKI2018_I69.XSR.g16832.t1.cds [Oikopleura dioica]|uniref:Oidioi.mRNA.OKI2018_I69.XSR.g16832.t1.cds n=1 Tax=Oikopleura dioica TaxID=34765 RepID=A0ABN7SHD2_OIKDI|nr:Oidioi.mRNA.OKI2018_I69.XSR.g16832.t1.cds [Oikopleura dioica]
MGAIQNEGDFLFRLNVYHNSSYLTRYPFQSFPLPKSLNQRIYLGAEVITQMDYFYIFTKSCWSAPSVEPNNTVSYPMMYNGCPADSFTFLQPRLNKEDRFETKTLRFPGSNFVYIQCDVIICDLRKANATGSISRI